MNYYNKTILLVEDEPINARLSIRTLEKYGYRVLHAGTGERAVDVILSTPGIDLILMDIDLGDGIDGTETAEIILKDHNIPLVFLSSHTEPEIVEKTDGITSYGYIVKNSGETILLASIKMAFRLFDAREKEKDKERKLREGEAKYRLIFENTGTSMFLVENDMTVAMVNDEFVRRFVYSKDEVAGRMKWTDFAHPDYHAFMKEQHLLRRKNEKAAASNYELKYVTSSGEIRDAHISVAMMPGMDNSIASITDLTEQKKAEEAIKNKNEELAAMNEEYEAANEELIQTIRQLEERENEFRLFFETSSSGIFLVSNGKLTMFNRAVSEITGYPEEEIPGRALVSFIHPDDVGLVTEHYSRIIKNGEIETSCPMRIVTPGGDVKWIGIKSRYIYWSGRRTTLNFISDITERKETEEALKIAEETYRNLFVNSQVGLFRTDIATGTIIEANDYLAGIFGFSGRSSLLSGRRSILESYTDTGTRDKIIGILKEHGEINNHEVLFKRKNGSPIWIQFSARLVPEKGWLQGVMEDITERKNFEEALSKRLIAERVISHISRMTSSEDSLEHFLEASLKIIGENLNLNRVYIFNYSCATDKMYSFSEWFSHGLSPMDDEFLELPDDYLPWWSEQLRSGGNICFSDIDDIPDMRTRDMLKNHNVLSILAVPLFAGGSYYGFIGFDDCFERHSWEEEDVELLLSVSRIITGFIERKRFEETLRLSEIKYRRIFEHIQDVIYQVDMDGVITELSPSIKKSSGFTREELIGRHVESVYFDPAERAGLVASIREKGQVIDYELNLKGNDGRLIYVSTSSHLIFDNHGNPSGIEGTLHDITRRKKIEQQLEKKRKRLDGIIKGTNAGTWEWDVQTGKTVFNSRWAEILGYSLEEISPMSIETWINFVHPDDLKTADGLLERHFRGELDYYECEFRMRHKNGQWVWILDRGKVIKRDENGTPLVMMGTHQDISQRKEAEEKIEQANRTRSMYLARLSHEIRTPLSGIIGMIDLVITADSDAERQGHLNAIKQSSTHLISIINDVLDFSRVESGSLVLESVPFNPVHEIRNAALIFSYTCSARGLYLDLGIGNMSGEEIVLGDPTRFRQVIINILGNAVKFTERGGIKISVERAEGSDNAPAPDILNLHISVKDTGPGIRADRLESIFMNFVQADPGISSRYGGTGLGLAISKELVELMGGAIYVQSEEGVGSNFIIDIPFRLSENDGIETSLPAQESAAGINDTKYSILVAEDDSVNSRLIVTMLGKQGHRAAVAENGEEVINYLLKESFDAVLMDVEMPVMSGLEAVRLIRGGAAGKGITGIPVIALTAYVSADIEEKCLNAGMDRCLSKPVKIQELNSVFSDLIGSKGGGEKER